MSEPQVIETTINRGGGGKVAIMEYGKIGSDYHVSITRKYAIPEDWTEDDFNEFEATKLKEFKDRLDPVLDEEFEERWSQRLWEDQS